MGYVKNCLLKYILNVLKKGVHIGVELSSLNYIQHFLSQQNEEKNFNLYITPYAIFICFNK